MMRSRWGWLDDSQTIVLVTLQGDWSSEDLNAYTHDMWPQIAQKPYRVHTIVDLRRGGLLPMQPIVHLVWLAQNRPKNAGRVIFVVKHALGLAIARALQSAMQRLYPQFDISGVLTCEEAVQRLMVEREDATVEVAISSRAEAGNQSPSGSPR